MPLSSPWKLAVSALNSVFASSRSVPDWLSAHAISCAASSSRICIIDGVSPEPMAYLWCIVSSLVVLALGIITFKKNQDKFVLYL